MIFWVRSGRKCSCIWQVLEVGVPGFSHLGKKGAKECNSCRSRKMLQNLVNHLNLEMVQPTARAHSPQPTAHSPSPSAGFYQVFARVKVQNGLFTFFEPSLERKCRKFMFFSRVKFQNGFFTFFWTFTRAKMSQIHGFDWIYSSTRAGEVVLNLHSLEWSFKTVSLPILNLRSLLPRKFSKIVQILTLRARFHVILTIWKKFTVYVNDSKFTETDRCHLSFRAHFPEILTYHAIVP